MNNSLEKLSIPIILLGSVWAAVGIIFQAFVVINERRDKVFALLEECGNCADKALTPAFIYWTNLFPLSAGLVIFLIVVTLVMLRLPHFIGFDVPEFTRKLVWSSWVLSTPLIFTILGFFVGWTVDFFYLIVSGRI